MAKSRSGEPDGNDYASAMGRIKQAAGTVLGAASLNACRTLAQALGDPAVSDEQVAKLTTDSRDLFVALSAMGINPGDVISPAGLHEGIKDFELLLTGGVPGKKQLPAPAEGKSGRVGRKDRVYMSPIFARLRFFNLEREKARKLFKTDYMLRRYVHRGDRSDSFYCVPDDADKVRKRLDSLISGGSHYGRSGKTAEGRASEAEGKDEDLVPLYSVIGCHYPCNKLSSKYRGMHVHKRLMGRVKSHPDAETYLGKHGGKVRLKDKTIILDVVDLIIPGLTNEIEAEIAAQSGHAAEISERTVTVNEGYQPPGSPDAGQLKIPAAYDGTKPAESMPDDTILTLAQIQTNFGITVGEMQNHAVRYRQILGEPENTPDGLGQGYTAGKIRQLQVLLQDL